MSADELIFVFGSNLAGRHGAGAAKWALRNHGAIYGQGEGRQGQSYAIPTKDAKLVVLPMDQIREHVERFAEYARRNSAELFLLTPIGCGRAGYTKRGMVMHIMSAVNFPSNVVLHKSWFGGANEYR